jgi:hypothetical protein
MLRENFMADYLQLALYLNPQHCGQLEFIMHSLQNTLRLAVGIFT